MYNQILYIHFNFSHKKYRLEAVITGEYNTLDISRHIININISININFEYKF